MFPAVVAFEQVGGDSPELDEFVLLQALSQRYVVEVVVGVDGCAQSLWRTMTWVEKLQTKTKKRTPCPKWPTAYMDTLPT